MSLSAVIEAGAILLVLTLLCLFAGIIWARQGGRGR